MNKTQLNKEQIEYIRSHYFNSGYVEDFTEDDIYWYLSEFSYIDTVDESKNRHWTEYVAIADLDGRFFGWHDADCGGDLSAAEKGFKASPIIKEYEPKEIKTIIYKPIKL